MNVGDQIEAYEKETGDYDLLKVLQIGNFITVYNCHNEPAGEFVPINEMGGDISMYLARLINFKKYELKR